MRRDEIVAYLEAYASRWAAPVREGVTVERLAAGTSSRFRLLTSAGEIAADTVVVCTGAFQRPFRTHASREFPPAILVLDSGDYRRPDDLPPGKILLVGSGQTGCQLAEELHLAGRDLFLACGKAPWLPRSLDGIDIFTWLARTSYFDQPLAALPSPAARLTANAQATGARGGHDLHYRILQALGVPLLGRLAGVDGQRAAFHDDLAASVAFGDARWTDMRTLLAEQLPAHGYNVPELPTPAPFACNAKTELNLRDFGVVIMTSGFRPDYTWIDFPVCDPSGFPVTVTAHPRQSLACTSAACTGCAHASQRCCSASARTPQSSHAPSLAQPRATVSRSSENRAERRLPPSRIYDEARSHRDVLSCCMQEIDARPVAAPGHGFVGCYGGWVMATPTIDEY